MKINRKYKVNIQSDTYSLPLLLGEADVKRVLKGVDLGSDNPLDKDFWIEVLGKFLTMYMNGNEYKALSIWHDVGLWGVAVAERNKLLIHDEGEPDLLMRNPKIFNNNAGQ